MRKGLFWLAVAAVLAATGALLLLPRHSTGDRFTRLVNRGNGFLEKGDTVHAASAYTAALRLSPESTDVRLNLANTYRVAGDYPRVVEVCRQVLALDHNSAAALYLMGCAYLDENQPTAAVQALQQSQKINPKVTALDYQLGLAQERLGHLAAAIHDFELVVRFDPGHPSAHYRLGRLYYRVGRDAEAAREMQVQTRIAAQALHHATQLSLESCQYTQPLAPFVLAQPARRGVPVHFTDATAAAFGSAARDYRGPLAVIDYDHDGRDSLFVMEVGKGFRLLDNRGGHFRPLGRPLAAQPGATYAISLVGDLDDAGHEDVVVLGEQDSRVFKFYAHGVVRDATRATGLGRLRARTGLLADLDFTGNLDLLTVPPDGNGVAVYRNLGRLSFYGPRPDTGLPGNLAGVTGVRLADWNNDDVPGVFINRTGAPPQFYAKQRAGAFTLARTTAGWPDGWIGALGDFNNDLSPDSAIVTGRDLTIVFNGEKERFHLPLRGLTPTGILPVDYDNDGWLDLIAWGPQGLRVWRNRGHRGFLDVTAALGLNRISGVTGLAAADFDHDGDTDLIVATTQGLQFWRNDGGNANHQLKLRLVGTRSNASALGVRVDLVAGDWHTRRTVRRLPLEIGVGRYTKIDAIKIHWFDLATSLVDVPVTAAPQVVKEPSVPSGSCPYLYAWNGRHYRFVSDILGSAPLGLPQSHTKLVAADPREYLVLGGDREFPARDGVYRLRITDELREILYLDEARLVAVDHPQGTRVLPTNKLLPGPPFPAPALWTLRTVARIRKATRSDGRDVTADLAAVDDRMVGPVQLRRPQLRGLAQPWSVTMDFGPLPVDRPLVLVLTGWLHFGGGMANIAASIDPTVPFPFPTLEAQLPDGSWRKVDVDVGAPSGKTKTILVDLAHKLPAGARRLRLTTAYEIYWDCARIAERVDAPGDREISLTPDRADLRWRGYSRFADLPPSLPLTPVYDRVFSTPPWDRTPSGWCTRYGPVGPLVDARDNRLVLMNGGDELALSFDARRLPPVEPGDVRDFFLYVVGWDKDADFHVRDGWAVRPLPFQGMDDQAYGRQPRPATIDDRWQREYDTRWVGPVVVTPEAKIASAP